MLNEIREMYKKEGKPAPKEMASTVYYNRGVLIAALHVEAISNALKAKPDGKITGADVKAGLREDLQLHPRRAGAAAQDHAERPRGRRARPDLAGQGRQVREGRPTGSPRTRTWWPSTSRRRPSSRRPPIGPICFVGPSPRSTYRSTPRAGGLRLARTLLTADEQGDHAESQQHRGDLRRRHPRAQGGVDRGARGRHHHPPRRQRRRQDHDAQGHLRAAPHRAGRGHQGHHRARWPAHRPAAGPSRSSSAASSRSSRAAASSST